MQNRYYRTFIGVPVVVSGRFLSSLEELAGMLNGERISWVAPERYHITIRFIGDTTIGDVKAIGSSLMKHVEVPVKTEINLEQLGSFGPRRNPKVIWVGFTEAGIFVQLKAGVDRILETRGIPSDPQPFRAHLTLGRVRSLRDRQNFYEAMERMKDRFSQKVIIDRLVFYRSEFRERGPVYTPLVEKEFGDQAL